MMDIIFEQKKPSVQSFNALKESVGWGIVKDDATSRGLNNSLYIVTALQQGKVIATGRVVGDGGLYFHIQDVIVLPEMQGKGVGTRIISLIMDYVYNHAPKNAMVGLMCAKGKEDFYGRFGFISRPDDTYGPGMVLLI